MIDVPTVVTAIFIGIMAWSIRTTQRLTEEVRAFRVTMFGETGTNGWNSTMKKLNTDLEALDATVEDLNRDLAILKSNQ